MLGATWIKFAEWGTKFSVSKYSLQKKELLPFVTAWMEVKIIILSGVSQSKKDKYHMISLICGI